MRQRGLFDEVEPPPPAPPDPDRVPRPYQTEAVAVAAERLAEYRSCLTVMGTGLGKTTAAALLAREVPTLRRRWRSAASAAGRVLFLVHRGEIVRDAAATFEAVCGEPCQVEMGPERATPAAESRHAPRLVSASLATISRPERLRRFARDEFTLIVVDEAHHAAKKNSTYAAVLRHFAPAKVFGLTATADRADGAALRQTFDCVGLVYPLHRGVDDGYLVRPRGVKVLIEGLRAVRLPAVGDDFDPAELGRIMSEDGPLHAVCREAVRIAAGRPGIVFAPTVDHARLCGAVLSGLGSPAAVLSNRHTRPAERVAAVGGYRDGLYQWLSNFGILGEGVDLPRTAAVVIARLTTSRALYEQMFGRAVRPDPSIAAALVGCRTAAERLALIAASPKPEAVVIDPVGVTSRHDGFGPETAESILGGEYADDVWTAPKPVARLLPRRVTPEEAAAAEARRAEAERVLVARSAAEFDAATAEATADVLGRADGTPGRPVGGTNRRRLTTNQIAALVKVGYRLDEARRMSWAAAARVFDEARRRRQEGLCTIRQGRILRRYGLPSDLPMGEARAAIDRISALGWPDPGSLPGGRL